MVAHLAGNWLYGGVWPELSFVGVAMLLIGIVGTCAVIAPRRWMLLALGVVVPVSVALQAPLLSNHWLLAGFVSLAYVMTGARWERFEPAARVILLVFYSYAAFSKLNTGFFDPTTSCGVFYANQWLGGFRLGPVPSSSTLAWVSIWGSAILELAIPILLVIRKTRTVGVLVALAFHGTISLDLGQHFYDFTAGLAALFVLFLPDTYAERFETVGRSIRPALQTVALVAVAIIGVSVTVANVTPLTPVSAWWLTTGSFLWWVPYLGLVLWAAFGSLQSVSLRWRLGPTTAILVGLVFLNGLTPYVELKTAFGWNMYSNLVVVDGTSNHLVIRSTVPLRDGHQNLVTIVSSDDPGLQAYADTRYLLPWPSFRQYAVANPNSGVVFERAGVRTEVARLGDNRELSAPVPWWWRWMPLRSIHAETPQQCQPAFLPAL